MKKENMFKVIRELRGGVFTTNKLYYDYDGFRKAVTITNRTICNNVGRVFQNCKYERSKKITIRSKTSSRRRYYSLSNVSAAHRFCEYPIQISYKGLSHEVCACHTLRNIKKTGILLSSFNKRNQGGYLK